MLPTRESQPKRSKNIEVKEESIQIIFRSFFQKEKPSKKQETKEIDNKEPLASEANKRESTKELSKRAIHRAKITKEPTKKIKKN